MWVFSVVFSFVGFSVLHAQLLGCPEPSQIEPCTCTNNGLTYLECRNIDDTEALSNVFIRSSKYRFTEVMIFYLTITFDFFSEIFAIYMAFILVGIQIVLKFYMLVLF